MTRAEAFPLLCRACGVSPASIDVNVFALYAVVDKLLEAEQAQLKSEIDALKSEIDELSMKLEMNNPY